MKPPRVSPAHRNEIQWRNWLMAARHELNSHELNISEFDTRMHYPRYVTFVREAIRKSVLKEESRSNGA